NPRLPPAEPGTERLRLFPNPTHGIVRIRVPDGQSPTAVRVCDVRGRETGVGTWSAVAPREYAVDLSDLAVGLYHLRVEIGGKWIRETVVVH
ncbi:MAG: T9SS type A sorting domain-containing protein, partial [Ferruginibacter sp.]|nr:T9SS type A sorting domain-containing protein [Cytophagales bacterium]